MISIPAIPTGLALGPVWELVRETRTRYSADLLVRGDDVTVEVRLERCAAGRLRDSYPVGAHDVEVRIADDCPVAVLPRLLHTLTAALQSADPACRRVVHAVRAGQLSEIAAAESAGFRYVVDVDLGQADISLLVAEPGWVARTTIDLDRVPGA
ncbi:hypothetical protein ACFWFF_02060 [Streptomyces sp. NPDC060223]|uniref:hypothetical protein n=1 Tax=unclassified Streptomyces TaxID=2593676 RepID=UPI00364450EE